MESLKKQAAKLLGEQKKYRRWLTIFLGLAIVVTLGTVAALKMNGQALSHKQKVLKCALELHEHTEECYESDPESGEKTLICGYADYAVHTHNDDCYDGDGELVCQLDEVEAHIHEESCYEEEQVLICELQESKGHVHTDSCKALICEKEESKGHKHTDSCKVLTCEKTEGQGHTHTDSCRKLICEKAETEGHQHTDACRTMTRGDLICENTEEGHEHTDDCYQQTENITCGLEEAEGHTHTDACYDAHGCGLEEAEGHTHTESCYDPHGCKLEEGEGHTHTESCYDPHACKLEEGEGHTHTEKCYETVKTVICGKLELHTHITAEEAEEGEESCYDTEGKLICKIPELKEHVHGEDCFETVELTKEEVEAMKNSSAESEEGNTDASGDGEEDNAKASGAAKDDNAGTESAEGGETDKAGENAANNGNTPEDGDVAADGMFRKVFEDEHMKVVAEYDSAAGIPEEAELFAEPEGKDGMADSAGTASGTTTPETESDVGVEAPEAGSGLEAPEAESGAGTPGAENNAEIPEAKNSAETPEAESGVETPEAENGSETQGADSGSNDSQAEETVPDAAAPTTETESPQARKNTSGVIVPESKIAFGVQSRIETVSEIKTPESATASESGADTESAGNAKGVADTGSDAAAESGTTAAQEEKADQSQAAEKVTEEITYRLGFRVNGEEITPKGTVTFTVWNLDEEDSEPETIVYSEGDDLESLKVTLRKAAEQVKSAECRRVYEDEEIRVIAEYELTAEIPDEAKLIVEKITDEEHFQECEAELQTHLENDEATMDMLLKIGFYIGDEEIEPKDTVSISIQFLNNDSIAEGDPINIIHFAKDKTEVLSGSDIDEEGTTTFVTDSFSDFGIMNMQAAAEISGLFGVSRVQQNKKIPIYEKNGNDWLEVTRSPLDLTSLENNFLAGITGDGDGYYIIVDAFTDYLTGYDVSKLTDWDAETDSTPTDAKWIAYSTDKGNTITTVNVQVDTIGRIYWLFKGITQDDLGSITGLYYLPNNTTEYSKQPLTSLGNSYIVEFDPSNGSAPQKRISVSVQLSEGSETAAVNLPGNNDFGKEFDFSTDENNPQKKTVQYPGNRPERKLVGWYNIADMTYYDVEEGAATATVDPKKNNVFYADWVENSYDFHTEGISTVEMGEKEEISKTFIKTRIIDYNELFNVYSSSVTKDTLVENWSDTGSFQPFGWDNVSAVRKLVGGGTDNYKSMLFLKGGTEAPVSLVFPSDRKIWNNSQDAFFNGLSNEKVLQYLFPKGESNNNALGVHFVGYGDYLYQYNEDTGYYEYKSSNNAVSYQKSDARFYVYNGTEMIENVNGKNTSFLPFNTYKAEQGAADNGNINYHFGMCTEVQFYLPAAPGYTTEQNGTTVSNQITGGDGNPRNMIFNFSGDDDVWVFVDDELILDMGGVHGALKGSIDFSTGAVTKSSIHASSSPNVVTNIKDKIGAGAHTLKVYYMERGAGLSNCEISFNILPRYMIVEPEADTVTVRKEWVEPDYIATPDSVTVQLYQDGKAYGDPVVLKADTDEDKSWRHTWSGLETKKTYTVQEVDVPGYESSINWESGQDFKYWAHASTLADTPEKPDENIIVILNQDSNNPVALSVDENNELSLSGTSVRLSNNVLVPESLTDAVKWKVEKSGNGYTLCNLQAGKYLTIGEKGISLSQTAGNEQIFKLVADEAYKGLVDSEGKRKVVYQEGGFKGESVNGNTDTVRVFRYHTVSSIVRNYTITNTYLPTITIQKADSKVSSKLLSGAQFRLTRKVQETRTADEEGKSGESVTKYSYYNGSEWINVDQESDLKGAAALAAILTIEKEIRLDNLLNGVYTLTEVTAPVDYMLPEKEEDRKIEFVVSGGKISEVRCGSFGGSADSGESANELAIAQIKEGSGGLILLVRNEKIPRTTANVRFVKYGTGTSEGKLLAGAQFELYKEDKDGTFLVRNGEIISTEGSAITDTDIVVSAITGPHESGEDGIFYTDNEMAGTYYVKELKAPDGYNRLNGLAKISVGEDGTVAAYVYTSSGRWEPSEMVVSMDITAQIPNADKATQKYYEVKIINIPGFELPETGSLGTKPFTIGGAMLITATAILMYGYSMRRRKSERRLKK